MIRHACLVLILALIGPVQAETARVYSGEHADFTRLVVELPSTLDWTLGRTALGYGFAVGKDQQPAYDLSQVWDRIPKTRLQALAPDPETGVLLLGLACSCHVFPFEYQPGIIVLDIKPGPAPEGSAFETALSVPVSRPFVHEDTPALIYDWLALDRESAGMAVPNELALATGEVSLDPLRTALLLEISKGAAQGVVDMALPEKPLEIGSDAEGTLPWSQIHIGPPPDTRLEAIADGKDARTPDGGTCAPDAALALADWGAGLPPLDLLAEARSDLYGELDLLNSEQVERAVKAHLYLGFGAEAAQYAHLALSAVPEDWAYLQSLAILVDGNPDPQSPFLDMLACDGAAALWALLAQPQPPLGMTVNGDAIARSFLALPPHLRASLGSGLAERLLAHGDTGAARIVRNAVERTPDVPSATVALMDAEADLQEGRSDQALAHAEAAVVADGSGVEEWIALVEAHFRADQPLASENVEAIRAFAREVEGSAAEKEYHRALALAEILAGQTATGFDHGKAHGAPLSDLWRAAVTLADDDAFLRAALSDAGDPGVEVGEDTALVVAQRLASLGFPDAALVWLGPTGPEDSPEKRRSAALAEFARGDARQTLSLLSGLNEPEDEALKAEALVQLGRLSDARAAYEAAELPEEALRLAAWEGAWTDLQEAGVALWAEALTDLAKAPAEGAPPLARGAASLEASAAARASITALLAGVAGPDS